MIIYLHGFLSSPQSAKAIETDRFFKQNYPNIELICPQLANQPQQVSVQLTQLIEKYNKQIVGFIGSSLGGYLAIWCAAQTNKPAVLINPAIKPYQLLNQYLGQHQHPYTGEVFEITPDFTEQLKLLEIEDVNALSLFAYIQTGDETLDYRQACDKLLPSQQMLIEGGNHAFEKYSDYLTEIADFLMRKTC